MAIIATAGESAEARTPAPEGTHQAVCVDVIDKGIIEMPGYDGKPPKKKHMVSIAWQLNELRDDGKRFLVYRRYSLSLNEKASLRKDLESWRGKAFTREEEMGFDVETVIGVNCLLNVQHRTKDGKTYANVVSIMPLVKGMPKLSVAEYVRETAENTTDQPDDDAPGGMGVHDDPIPFARMGGW